MEGPYLCPNCGSTEAVQNTTQYETVHADANGYPQRIETNQIDVVIVKCADCDETLVE